jgi:hypothetical protein
MHGGFENETPNIPTNSIMKLDLIAHVKGNAGLMAKIEAAFASQAKSSGTSPSSNRASESGTGEGLNGSNNRATTPPI